MCTMEKSPSASWTYSYVDSKEAVFAGDDVSNHPPGADIYWLPAHSKSGKRKKADISGSHWVMADYDPPPDVWQKNKGETSPGALDKWRAEILRRLKSHEPRFTLIVDSGRGYQAGYELTYMGQQAEIEAARYALAGAFGEEHRDACHDISRVFRMWGTVNSKTVKTASVLRYEPENKHALHDLPAEQPAAAKKGKSINAQVDSTVELQAVQKKYFPEGDVLAAIIEHGRDIGDPGRFGGNLDDDSQSACDRSGAIWYVVNELKRCSVPDEVSLGLLLNEKHGISHGIYYQRKGDGFIARRDPEAEARRQLGRVVTERQMAVNDNGIPYKTPSNFRIGLELLGITIRHNEFADRYEVEGLPKIGDQLDDAIITRVRVLFDEKFKWFPARDFTADMLKDSGVRNRYHPVRDHLDGLIWDGVPRLDTWLIEAGGAKDTPFVRAASRLTLMAAVRRIRQPGIKFDQMLVLESAQGWNKSTALALLAINDDWFTDKMPLGADSKHVIEDTRGKFLVECAELHGMRKGDIDKVKASLSRTTDRARLAYARCAIDVPRQFIAIGTTNNNSYLKDLTGNRRFWPVKIEKPMDLEWLREHKDQLWAEADAAKGSLALDPSLYNDAAVEQAARRQESPMAITLGRYLGDATGKIAETDVWIIVGIPAAQRLAHISQLRSDMAEAGWEFNNRIRFGDSIRCAGYRRGDTVQQQTRLEAIIGSDGKPCITAHAGDVRAIGKAISDDLDDEILF